MTGKIFHYKDFSIDENRTESQFSYSLITDEKTFNFVEQIRWPQPLQDSLEISKLHQALHLALGLSYYKSFIPPVIEHPYVLTEQEAGFWNKAFKNGLGEFLYKNKLSQDSLAQFTSSIAEVNEIKSTLVLNKKVLLGLGGGKDSIVAGELLKQNEIDVSGFVLATKTNTGVTKDIAKIMGIELNIVERTLDPQLLTIGEIAGAYSGHIPISLIFALVGSVLAVNSSSAYVVVANESTASLPQVESMGREINHQWSKSLEFEKLFQDFIHQNISPNLRYFSAIRPLSSVAVARIFAKYPQYFEHFTSDNSLFKVVQEERTHPRWSPESSKSLSSFILLAPWLSDDDLMRTFGKNFLDDISLQAMFANLLGRGDTAILDCVGSPEELKSSLAKLVTDNRFTDTELVKLAVNDGYLTDAKDLSEFIQLSEDLIPPELTDSLLRSMKDSL